MPATDMTLASITTERYERTYDLSGFNAEDRPAIAEAIRNAEGAAIIAVPFRYLPNSDVCPGGTGHTFVAFREREAEVREDYADKWYGVLDINARTHFNDDNLLNAWCKAREVARG